MVIFQKCICCLEPNKELYTADRYACHRTEPVTELPEHNKLCETCATDLQNHPEETVNNNCVGYCRIHGQQRGREDAA